MKYLNVGCGTRFDEKWTNLDYVPAHPSVLTCDIRTGIPFPDNEFDAVYHSHLLEHLRKDFAPVFLRECFRVLKAGGTIRVVVPDLERITRAYLDALEMAVNGEPQGRENYDWMMLELYDQTVRERDGGEMATYLARDDIRNRDFVVSRIGTEIEEAMKAATTPSPVEFDSTRPTFLRRLFYSIRHPKARKEAIVRRLLDKEHELLELGRFRHGGEVHLWMYDRYSLAEALRAAGFRNPQTVGPAESRIPSFADYHLDTDFGGKVRKPDSLFMEAVK